MDKQQTAVEWIQQQIRTKGITHNLSIGEILDQAKEMEKEQIIEAYQQGITDEHGDTITFATEGEDYYNQTYGGNK